MSYTEDEIIKNITSLVEEKISGYVLVTAFLCEDNKNIAFSVYSEEHSDAYRNRIKLVEELGLNTFSKTGWNEKFDEILSAALAYFSKG